MARKKSLATGRGKRKSLLTSKLPEGDVFSAADRAKFAGISVGEDEPRAPSPSPRRLPPKKKVEPELSGAPAINRAARRAQDKIRAGKFFDKKKPTDKKKK